MTHPVPENEQERLKVLQDYRILDSQREEEFDRLVRLALTICDVPIALISLIDKDRQWFKAVIGLEDSETSRDDSFCQYTILQDEMLIVKDALEDDRFRDNALVVDDPNIRFYAGKRLLDPQGFALGSFCVIDRVPRELSKNQQEVLKILADEAVYQIVARRERENLRKFENLFQLSDDLMWVMKKDGTLVECNPEFHRVTQEQNGQELNINTWLGPDDRQNLERRIEQLSAGNAKFTDTFLLNLRGFELPQHTQWNVSWDENSGLVYVIARNITESIRLNEELRKAKELAERNAEAKDLFLANMSHEIRTPLNAIIGFSNLMEETRMDKEQREFTSIVQRASHHLLSIINDILDFSKIESGQITIEKIPFSLREVATDVCNLLKYKAEEKKIELKKWIDPALPENLNGDPTRINQVIMNLMGNALKFTESGEVSLSVNVISDSAEECTVELNIADTGIGIPEDKLHGIFERFTQANTDTTRKFGGTGLGLSISKSLVELQGGRISVASEINHGTVFTVQLAFTKVSAEQKAFTPPEKMADEKQIQILLVEDNIQNQKLAIKVMSNFGFHVELAENGQIAVDRLKEERFDLVVMDLQMPVMDGYRATEIIRQELKMDIPIIAMTAHSLVGEKQKCLDIGMDEYIPKPFYPQELKDKILLLVHRKITENQEETKKEAQAQDGLIYDFAYLNELTNDNEEFIREMIELFIEQSASELELLKNAIRDLDFEEIEAISHRIKSSFQFFMIRDEQLLSRLEQAGRNKHGERLEEMFSQLTEIHRLASEQLGKHLKTGE
ncbi:MAG: hypothetical protein K0R65_2848 [Crocinitomicaceae bacterium]|nr:hypothetical protein [Crocinitomicaceae bacterium]